MRAINHPSRKPPETPAPVQKPLTKCEKPYLYHKLDRERRLEHYEEIVKNLDREDFDGDANLKPEFLKKFTCRDLAHLIQSYIKVERLGTYQNTWELWAQQHPEHTAPDWATLYVFWLARRLPESLRNWDAASAWEEKVPLTVMTSMNASDINDILLKRQSSKDEYIKRSKDDGRDASVKGQFWDLYFDPIFRKPIVPKAPDSNPQEMSRLARKFGPSEHFQYRVTGEEGHTMPRSGLTPTEPLFRGNNVLNLLEQEKAEEYMRYQWRHINFSFNFGWKLKEYHLLEVLSEELNVKPSGLTNEISPVFAREVWLSVPERFAASMPDGRFWDPQQHDDLWAAMCPALRLASRFVSETHLETWWDDLAAALNFPDRIVPGNLAEINPPIHPNRTNHYIKKRDPSSRFHDKRIDWEFFASKISLEIRSNNDDAVSAYTRFWHRHTDKDSEGYIPPDPNGKNIVISGNHMTPLMLVEDHSKMTEAEKLIFNFWLAVTLAHELTHAYCMVFWPFRQPHEELLLTMTEEEQFQAEAQEPFYGDEDFGELGWSMESNVFGGGVAPLMGNPREKELKRNPRRRAYPNIGFMMEPPMTWFNKNRMSYQRNTEKWESEHQLQGYEIFPISLHYYEEIQQDDFWNVYASVHGGELLRPGSVVRMQILGRQGELTAINSTLLATHKFQLDKILETEGHEKRRWWTDDKSRFNDPLTRYYRDRKMDRDSNTALLWELTHKEEERHKMIRERRATWQDRIEVDNYQEKRERDMLEYLTRRNLAWGEPEIPEGEGGGGEDSSDFLTDDDDDDWNVDDGRPDYSREFGYGGVGGEEVSDALLEVNKILDVKVEIVEGVFTLYFQVDWVGDSEPTWEPESTIHPDLIKSFLEARQEERAEGEAGEEENEDVEMLDPI